ncbi:iron-containing redox enzyme family protein [Streptomyces sp. 4N509B]|uniref:iron-containing redox enzyme family protein n=1 Tax=Streptomyces sp. 4N509B TaxID=3457413 RepID=UPI003FD3BC86
MTSPPGAGRELRALLSLVSPAVRHGAAALWRPEGLTERYLRYLTTMHAVIRASVPLMELAAARCREAATSDGPGAGDPGLRALARFLPEHIERERHHDDWLLRDMAAAGLDPARERARPPAPVVARLVGAQYYWVSHHHPVSLLGYIAVLELHAPAVELAGTLAERTGLPPAAFATLRLHAEEDDGHSAEVLTALDEAATSDDARGAARLSALHTVAALLDVFDELNAHPRAARTGQEQDRKERH